MKEKITTFLSPITEILKRIFTPFSKGFLYSEKSAMLFRVLGILAVILLPFACCFVVELVNLLVKDGLLVFENNNDIVKYSLKVSYVIFTIIVLFVISVKKGFVNKFLRVASFALMAIFPFCCYFTLEFVHYASKTKFINFIVNRKEAVIFGILLIYLIYLLLLLIFKKGFIASAILGIATIGLSVSNYYKFALTGDYIYPWDIAQNTGNMGELASFLSNPLPWWVLVLYAGIIILTILTFLTKAELPVRFLIRLPFIIMIIYGSYIATDTPEKSTELLNKNGLYFEDMALQTSNYSANGFVGAFTVNVLSSGVTKPESYSEETVNDLMSLYAETPAGENFKNPDIILILSESFWDPTKLPGVEFSADPLENFREIASREGVISGNFYTTGFGGGTVRPEFEVLTGLTTDFLPGGSVPYQYVTSPLESYVSIYHDLGYRTLAIHPYNASFYLRKQGYPFIGIDELYFEDSLYALKKEVPYTISGKQISDDSFVDYIKYYLGQSTGDTFVMGISMENHQPYTNKFSKHDIAVTSSVLEPGILSDLTNFTQGVYEADLALKKLVDYVDSRDKETILVYFGDHLPTLGANYAAYNQSGAINLDGMTPEMNKFLYSTPFLIYSNFELEESDMLKVGSENEIASYNLMNAVSTLIDAPRTKYMHFLEDYFKKHPANNIRLWSINKKPFEEFIEGHKIITYDRTVGERYSLD